MILVLRYLWRRVSKSKGRCLIKFKIYIRKDIYAHPQSIPLPLRFVHAHFYRISIGSFYVIIDSEWRLSCYLQPLRTRLTKQQWNDLHQPINKHIKKIIILFINWIWFYFIHQIKIKLNTITIQACTTHKFKDIITFLITCTSCRWTVLFLILIIPQPFILVALKKK